MESYIAEGVGSGRGEELGLFWQLTSHDKKAWCVQRPEDERASEIWKLEVVCYYKNRRGKEDIKK